MPASRRTRRSAASAPTRSGANSPPSSASIPIPISNRCRSRLQKISQAAATGGLVVSGAMMAIPGAVGIVVSNAGTSSRVDRFGARQDRRPAHGHQPREDAGDGPRPPDRRRAAAEPQLHAARHDLDGVVARSRAGAGTRRIPAPRGRASTAATPPCSTAAIPRWWPTSISRPARSRAMSRPANSRSTRPATAVWSASGRSMRCRGPRAPAAR